MSNWRVGVSKVTPSDKSEVDHMKDETLFRKQETVEKNSHPLSAEIKNPEDLLGLLEAKHSMIKDEDEKTVLHSTRLEKQKTFGSGFALMTVTNQLSLVKAFVGKIKSFSSFQRFRNTKRHLFELINDVAFDFDYFYYREIFQNHKPSKLKKSIKFIQTNVIERMTSLDPRSGAVMLPNSMMSRIWDSIQLVFLLIYIIYLPIRLAFELDEIDTSLFYLFEAIPNIIQIVNLFLEFNTGFYRHGVVIVDRAQIFHNYIRKKFIYDFILNICWLISLSDDVSNWFKAIGMLRIIVLLKLLSEVEQTFSLREMFGNYFSLVKLGGFIFLCAHLCGCGWYALAIYEKSIGVKTTWLDRDIVNFEGAEDNVQAHSYIASIYWCIVTMTTIGYGDIIPATFRERMFSVVMCVIASFIFAFSMSSIGDIIRSFSLKQEEFKQNMAVLNVYMKRRKLNLELQTRVRKYYENLKMEEQNDNEKGAEMIHSLNSEIRDDVLREIFTSIFKNVKFFKNQFSDMFISKLYQFAEEKHVPVDEVLFREGDKADILYLIIRGEVQLTIQTSLNMQVLKENDLIGPVEFMTTQKYAYSAKCNRFCQFIEIKQSDFMKVIKETTQDYERYCELRDSLLLNQDAKKHKLSCEGCSQKDHLFLNCPYINLSKQTKARFVEINKRKQITRLPWDRKGASYQALKSQFQIASQAQEFMEQQYYERQINNSGMDGSPTSNIHRKNEEVLVGQSSGDEIEEDRLLRKSASKIKQNKTNQIHHRTMFEYHGVGTLLHINEETHSVGSPKLLQISHEQEDTKVQNKPSRLDPLPPILLKGPLPNREEDNFTMKLQLSGYNGDPVLQHKHDPSGSKTETHQRRNSELAQNGENYKRKQLLPHLSQRTNKFSDHSSTITKSHLDQAYTPLYDPKRNKSSQPHSRMATIVNIEPDDKDEEIYNSQQDLVLDRIHHFDNYMTHNNYKHLIVKYNDIISKNKLYQSMIEKARIRSEQKKKTEVQRRKTLFKNTIKPNHKRIPSSQLFYQERAAFRSHLKNQYQNVKQNENENTD